MYDLSTWLTASSSTLPSARLQVGGPNEDGGRATWVALQSTKEVKDRLRETTQLVTPAVVPKGLL